MLRSEPRLVDQALRMLDAKAQAEGLGLDGDAAFVQHFKGVAGAVAQRQHHMAAFDFLAVFQADAAHAPLLVQKKIDHLALEAIFAAQLFDGLAHAFHHRHQPEGADMGMGLGEDFLRRASLDELGQHLAAQIARILDLAVELAVGKSSGAAFAELDIGFRIENRAPPQAPGILGALAHHLAALQDDGPKAGLRQDQGGEKPARPRADHQRPLQMVIGEFRRCLGHGAVFHVGRGTDVPGRAAFVLQRHIHRIDVDNRVLVARVMGALEDAPVQHRLGRQLELFQDGGLQRLRAVVERQLDVGKAQHGAHIKGDAI